MKNQVSAVDIHMLNVPKVRNTPENIELKEYLLQRIMAMKSQKSKMSETIKYETIYEYLRIGITAPTRNAFLVKCKQVRDKVKQFLEFWKSKELIKDYREEKEGKLIAKIVIII